MDLFRWCPQRLTLAGNPLAATELRPSGARGESLAPRGCHGCPCDARAASPGSFSRFLIQHIRGAVDQGENHRLTPNHHVVLGMAFS